MRIPEKVSHFEILELIGKGGFGEVYKARDTRLNRLVAIKILSIDDSNDPKIRERLLREAKAASTLNHPNICAVYDVGVVGEGNFIVMELIHGITLRQQIAGRPLSESEAIEYAIQIADALAEAHQSGIIHRDIKSSNILITKRKQVKILDFGLAKMRKPAAAVSTATEAETLSSLWEDAAPSGSLAGTLPYMSPEQVLGGDLDPRSDLFSFGVVLYEMLTGTLPFQGNSAIEIADAVLHKEPAMPDCDPKLAKVLSCLLKKNREGRYRNAGNTVAELCEIRTQITGQGVSVKRAVLRQIRKPAVRLVILLLILTAAGVVYRTVQTRTRTRWARVEAIPQIKQLGISGKYFEAVALATEVEKYFPKDPDLNKLWPLISYLGNIETDPAGADVFMKPYVSEESAWKYLGKSPLKNVRLPGGTTSWKFKKSGYLETRRVGRINQTIALDKLDSVPPHMVRVTGSQTGLNIPGLDHLPEIELHDYWIDKHEVTNEQYKKFVSAGGYQKREYWKQPFIQKGRELTWDEAMVFFRDSTGRPGPATWEGGTYPKGKDRFPVCGISWYEAAAYAEFSGKNLPTIYHWNYAATAWHSGSIVPLSNFRNEGPIAVDSDQAMSGFGTYAMAGNVKEWCWNESGDKRFILGGAWGEPTYMFTDADAQSPFDRQPAYGFRCVRYGGTLEKAAFAPIVVVLRDYRKEQPVPESIFEAYRRLYTYDKNSVNVKVESAEQTHEWRKEKITFDAAYGSERMSVYLFLPKNTKPPYQTVLFFPPSDAIFYRSFVDMPTQIFDFIVEGGRAVIIPIFKGTFDRKDKLTSDYPEPTANYRDHVIQWAKDLGRSIDYLETRRDIDSNKLGYYGYSWGAPMGVIMTAVDPRFQASVLAMGGFYLQKTFPEVDQINFTPHVKVPTLMLNGRYDFFFPTEHCQIPMFQLIRIPEKRHEIYESGHVIPRSALIKETLDWLDRYLGPVR